MFANKKQRPLFSGPAPSAETRGVIGDDFSRIAWGSATTDRGEDGLAIEKAHRVLQINSESALSSPRCGFFGSEEPKS